MEENIDIDESIDSKKKGFGFKIIIIGLPLFIIQLVVVYFITANIILDAREDGGGGSGSHNGGGETSGEVVDGIEGEGSTDTSGTSGAMGTHLYYTVEDVIINPAGTSGQRLMLVSVGFDVPGQTHLQKLQSKEILVKDMIISTLSSRTLGELTAVGFKDTLKVILMDNLKTEIPDIEVNNVFFGKYIIQ